MAVTGQCHYFAKTGSCKYGDKCKYVHDKNLGSTPPTSPRKKDEGKGKGRGKGPDHVLLRLLTRRMSRAVSLLGEIVIKETNVISAMLRW